MSDNWIEGSIAKIAAMRGRELSEITENDLTGLFMCIGEIKTRALVNKMKMLDNVPSNISGWCERNVNEIDGVAREQAEWKDNHDEIFGSRKETEQLAIFLDELMKWHKLGLSIYNPNGCGMLDAQQWLNADCPKTWSNVLDCWMDGFCKVYKSQGDIVLDFLTRFNDHLKTEREKRMAA